MTATAEGGTESQFDSIGEFKVHYHIAKGLHQMDAIARNRAEAELLALMRELSGTIGAPFQVETKAREEGGVVELWNLVFQHKEQIAFVMAILGPLLSAAPFYKAKLRQSKQQTVMNELTIQKLKLELAEKEDAAVERAEKKQRDGKTDALPLEPPLTPEEVAKALLSRKKIARRRSNYDERLIEDPRIEAVGFAPTHRRAAPEQVVQRGNFTDFVVARADLEPLVYRDVPIEVVSPVLRSGGLKWRGVFDKKVISFDLEDREFKDRVTAKRVQFQNGTQLRCDLEVLQREDETGDVEIAGYVVSAVHEVRSPPPPLEPAIDQQFVLPLGSSSRGQSGTGKNGAEVAPSS